MDRILLGTKGTTGKVTFEIFIKYPLNIIEREPSFATDTIKRLLKCGRGEE